MRPDIKICGLRTPEAVDRAAARGASHIGFIFFDKSLRNIEQHAQATQVTIRLRASLDHATVEVHDNGVGFATRLPDGASIAAQPLPASGHSLRQLQYRLELAGGHFNVSTSPGQGTTVRASVPLAAWMGWLSMPWRTAPMRSAISRVPLFSSPATWPTVPTTR